MENYINTDHGHGVIYNGCPLLNANDHKPKINLTHFGDCKARAYYEELKRQLKDVTAENEGDNTFNTIGKKLLKNIGTLALTVDEYMFSSKCEIDTPTAWLYGNEIHMLDGAPALTIGSTCTCRRGGVISFVLEDDEQESEDIEKDMVDAKVKDYEAKLFEENKDLINQYYELAAKGENRTDKENEQLEKIQKDLAEVNIIDILQQLGDEVNSMPAIQNNINNPLYFVGLVNSNEPLDLKNRKQINTETGEQYPTSIWTLPWGDGAGGTVTGDYAGNWFFGYMGAEYFTLFGDGAEEDAFLKFGAGGAQLLSDVKHKGDQPLMDVLKKYANSLMSGNYGDNENGNGKSDAQMIQEGIDAYKKTHQK